VQIKGESAVGCFREITCACRGTGGTPFLCPKPAPPGPRQKKKKKEKKKRLSISLAIKKKLPNPPGEEGKKKKKGGGFLSSGKLRAPKKAGVVCEPEKAAARPKGKEGRTRPNPGSGPGKKAFLKKKTISGRGWVLKL